MRKILLILVMLMIINVSFAASEINIIIDSEHVVFSEEYGKPFIDENNRTQVPLRAVLEHFGAEVGWRAESSTATVSFKDILIEIPIGKSYIVVNGKHVENDTESLIKDGRTYLPLRVVFENLGAEVLWDGDTKSVLVKSQDIAITEITIGTEVGMKANSIESINQFGKAVSLDSFVGKPVLLSYYSTW